MRVILNNRNWVTSLRGMVEVLKKQGHEVTILDNQSTYPPLLSWYETCGLQIHRLPNLGNKALWVSGLDKTLCDDYFVYSDCDYDISMLPDDWSDVLMEGFSLFPGISKVGLSFEEKNVPPENPAYELDQMGVDVDQQSFARWGNRVQMGHGFLRVPVDTSFAIYPPHSGFSIGGIRKDRPYCVQHLPWHFVLEKGNDPTKRYEIFDDEAYYYFSTCENSSYTAGRLSKMISQYEEVHGLKGV